MITLHVNGTAHTIDVPDEMPLLWALRDILDLKGTKFGCGIAQCGACTVHVNGEARPSCITRVSAVDGAQIRTIEGLSADGTHALQRAWMELDVPQCGYCQAGQLMSAAALLEETPEPTDADIDAAMNGNLCRCTTYLRIRRAIHHAASLQRTAVPVGGSSGAQREDPPPTGESARLPLSKADPAVPHKAENAAVPHSGEEAP